MYSFAPKIYAWMKEPSLCKIYAGWRSVECKVENKWYSFIINASGQIEYCNEVKFTGREWAVIKNSLGVFVEYQEQLMGKV